MERRKFLQLGGGATLATMLNGLPVSTYAGNPLLQLLAKQTGATGRVLVLIQLSGGNDGLNTVIPLDQYSAIAAARSNIMIPQNAVLPLTGNNATGLHPAMARIQQMYNDGKVNITQSVGYPDPNFSHFRATDIWTSASDANQYLNSGWIGRHLNESYPGYPTGYPNAAHPDPLAIQIGTGVSPVLQGPNVNMGIALSDINSFYNIINSTVDPAPPTPAGHELTFIRYVSQQTQQYTSVLQAAAMQASNLSTLYPTGNRLSDPFKIIARLVAGGLQTPIYVVNLGSFDTHSAQTDAADHTVGVHASLLRELSEAVYAFYDDLKLNNVADRVAAMTFSEFGRRIKSNSSGGTDHGTTAPVFVFGNAVNPAILGANPVLPANANPDDNLPLGADYRSIYAAVLADWFDVPPAELADVLLQNFPILPVFKKALHAGDNAAGSNDSLGQNFPNPFRSTTSVAFGSSGGRVTLQLFDATGRLLGTPVDGDYPRGTHKITLERAGLPAGIYFLRMTTAREKATRQLTVVD